MINGEEINEIITKPYFIYIEYKYIIYDKINKTSNIELIFLNDYEFIKKYQINKIKNYYFTYEKNLFIQYENSIDFYDLSRFYYQPFLPKDYKSVRYT